MEIEIRLERLISYYADAIKKSLTKSETIRTWMIESKTDLRLSTQKIKFMKTMVKLTAEQYLNKCIIKRRHDDARREKVWSVLIAGMLWVSTACIIKFLILAL